MQFKRTVVFYPVCILAIWLHCVFLGVAANALTSTPPIAAKLEARQALAAAPADMPAADRAALRRQAAGRRWECSVSAGPPVRDATKKG